VPAGLQPCRTLRQYCNRLWTAANTKDEFRTFSCDALHCNFVPGASMTITHDTRNFFLAGPAGRLEAILWTPLGAAHPPLAAVVCHPHPLFGGTLHNKVVYQTGKALDALGVPVLRFNFRGAGLSTGVHDRGAGEQGDVLAALAFLASEFPGVPLLLAGFSFGAWVGLRVGCEDTRVSRLLGLGIPVNSTDFSFLRDCNKCKLFVHGSNDEFGAIDKVRALVPTLPGNNHLVVVEGVDHFFAGKLGELGRAIDDWLSDDVFGIRR
jgi:alpha/beta superfamily hydrolase